MIGRVNFASALVEGRGVGRPAPLDPIALVERHGRDRDGLLAFFAELLFGAEPSPAWRDRIEAAVGAGGIQGPEGARRAVALMLASPEAQLT
jgi:hypothetical protein